MSDFRFEIKEHIGVIAKNPSGWQKELNVVEWNGKEPKYDLREWDESHTHCSRGVTMTVDEVVALLGLLKKRAGEC